MSMRARKRDAEGKEPDVIPSQIERIICYIQGVSEFVHFLLEILPSGRNFRIAFIFHKLCGYLS